MFLRGADTLTNLQTYTQIFSQYSGISSLFFGCYKRKGTLLQELQPKYDTYWMGYWTGKILTSCHSKFHCGIYCLFLRLSWRKISRYFVLEKFVCFHLWEEYDLMHCLLLDEMFWLRAKIADWIWSIVWAWNIFNKIQLQHHLTMSTFTQGIQYGQKIELIRNQYILNT